MLTPPRVILRFLTWRPGRRGLIVTAILAALAFVLVFPRAALADCSSLNPIEASSCGMDSFQYGVYETAASILWGFNRILLVGAYQLDAIRANTIEVAFAGAYNALITVVSPAILPVGTLALILAMLAIIAMPITGSKSPFNVRQILIWLVAAPILLTYLGEGLLTLETMRMDLGNSIFQAASAADFGQATLGAPGATNDFGAVPMLYPNNLCDATLERHSGGSWSAGDRRIDELVAGFLFANAVDIHCPWKSPGAGILPSGFYNREPPYAAIAGIRSAESPERQAYMDGIKQGLQRQIIGLLPSILALLYFLLNLIFSLSLVAVWVALPIGMVFGFFAADMGWFSGYVKKAAGILQASWVASFIVGLLLAALMRASLTGNGTVFVGVAGGSMFFMLYSMGGAIQAFQGALGAVTAALGSLGGMAATSMQTAQGMLSGGARLGAMALTGSTAGAAGVLKTGLTGAMALKNTGSMRYAAGAMLAQNKGVAETLYGAATLVGDDPTGNDMLAGVQFGQAAQSSFRAANGALRSAAPRVRQHHNERPDERRQAAERKKQRVAERKKQRVAEREKQRAAAATKAAPAPAVVTIEDAPPQAAPRRPRPRPSNAHTRVQGRAYRPSSAGGGTRDGAGRSSQDETARRNAVRRYRPSASASGATASDNAPPNGMGRTYYPSAATSPSATGTATSGTDRTYRPSAASGPARKTPSATATPVRKGRKGATTAPGTPSFRQAREDARAMFVRPAPAPTLAPEAPQTPPQTPAAAPAPAAATAPQGRKRQRPAPAQTPEAAPGAPTAPQRQRPTPAQTPEAAPGAPTAPQVSQGRKRQRPTPAQTPEAAPVPVPEAPAQPSQQPAPAPAAVPEAPQVASEPAWGSWPPWSSEPEAPAQTPEAASAPTPPPEAPQTPAQVPEVAPKVDDWLGEWPS